MKNKKAGLKKNIYTLPLMQGGASFTFDKNYLLPFLFNKYEHHDSNLFIMKDGCKVFLGRALNEQEEDTLKQILICMDGFKMLEIQSILELMFTYKRLKEHFTID